MPSRLPVPLRVARPPPEPLDTLCAYIDTIWGMLTRSHDDLLEALPDEKVDHESGTPGLPYVAATEDTAAVARRLCHSLTADEWAQVDQRGGVTLAQWDAVACGRMDGWKCGSAGVGGRIVFSLRTSSPPSLRTQ